MSGFEVTLRTYQNLDIKLDKKLAKKLDKKLD